MGSKESSLKQLEKIREQKSITRAFETTFIIFMGLVTYNSVTPIFALQLHCLYIYFTATDLLFSDNW